MFFWIDSTQRQFETKLQKIRAGEVPVESLTVIRKYVNTSRHRSNFPHVVLKNAKNGQVNCSTSVDFFNSVNLGDKVNGYNFPDGYFIPDAHGGDAGTAKWFFLGFGFWVAVIAAIFAAAQQRLKRAQTISLWKLCGPVFSALRNRGRKG